MSAGRVIALHLKPESGGVAPVDRLEAIRDVGFVGDKCAGRKSRQALFLGQETLDEFGYAPGQLREQITVEFPGLQRLPVGSKLKAGEAIFTITADCAPCGGMARNLGEEEESFKSRLAGKRGMLAVVDAGGSIRIGDPVTVVDG